MTAAAFLAARFVLAGTFAVAGAAKLADRSVAREGIVGFGVPTRFAGAAATLLALSELTVAALLIPASTALLGALGALVLLAGFTAAIAWSLARGRTPECRCFGQLHSAPASWRTLARNGALLALAGLVVVDSTTSAPVSAVAWMADRSSMELVAVLFGAVSIAFLAIGGVVLLSLVRSYGRVLTRLDRVETALTAAGIAIGDDLDMPEIGLAPGTPTPFFVATAVGGEQISAETLAASAVPTLLLFTSPHCGPCASLMPTVAGWQRDHGDRLSVVLASSGSAEEVREEAQRHGLERVLHDGDNRLSELFEANGTPSALLIAPDGTIASRVASGAEWIEQLVASVVDGGGEDGLPIGAEAPDLELPSLTGETVSLASLRGRDTVLVFWNPQCGFCRSMHDDLLAWEASADGADPRLVAISSSDATSARAEGFRSLVLLDEGFDAGEAFKANGTPMAVLVDAEGRIASPVVAGSEAVLALAGAH